MVSLVWLEIVTVVYIIPCFPILSKLADKKGKGNGEPGIFLNETDAYAIKQKASTLRNKRIVTNQVFS